MDPHAALKKNELHLPVLIWSAFLGLLLRWGAEENVQNSV